MLLPAPLRVAPETQCPRRPRGREITAPINRCTRGKVREDQLSHMSRPWDVFSRPSGPMRSVELFVQALPVPSTWRSDDGEEEPPTANRGD